MKKVFLLDDNQDLLDVMSGLIEMQGAFHCVTALTFEEMRGKESDALESTCCFLDINLGEGKPGGTEAYRWLQGRGYQGEVFFLTGHLPNNPRVAEALGLKGTRVLSKPIELNELERILHEQG